MTSQHDSNPNVDRRERDEDDRRERAEDRKIGQIILGGLAVLALVFGFLFMFIDWNSTVANRSDATTTAALAQPQPLPLLK